MLKKIIAISDNKKQILQNLRLDSDSIPKLIIVSGECYHSVKVLPTFQMNKFAESRLGLG